MEVQLINKMIRTIFKEGLEDKGFIEEKTEGIKELRERISALQSETPELMEVEKAARIYARAKRAMILIGSGLWSYLDPKEIAIASSNLALITGHIGKKSCGILFLLEKSNTQGAVDMGIFSEEGVDGNKAIRQKLIEEKIKALYLIGEDPLISSPILERQALEKIPFMIVQDLFLTETAKKAHVVLPACSFIEKEGTFTNLERRVQKLNALRSPLGQSKSDFNIFLSLLRLLEYPIKGESPEAIFEEISHDLPHYQGIQDGEQWPKNKMFLYENGFPAGRAKLIPLETNNIQPQPGSFYLIQKPSLFKSGHLSSKSDSLKIVSEKPYLEMNPEDGQLLKIEDGETIQISTQKGQSFQMKVEFSSKLVSGVITAPYPCPMIDERGIGEVKVEKLKKI
jgi:predicted molibdopterin-dependent oxidoreductase YjgC